MPEQPRVIAVRRHIGGWVTSVLLLVDDDGEPVYAWASDAPTKRRGEPPRRSGRLSPTLEEAQAAADAWLTTQGHSCTELECRAWAPASGTERANADHLRWAPCTGCEQYFPLDELQWLGVDYFDGTEHHRTPYYTVRDARDPDSMPYCARCATDVLPKPRRG